MTNKALSFIKILTALSFLCIQVVFSNMMVVPMLFVFLLGFGSIVTGDPGGFIFSLLSLISTGYLVFSAGINRQKVNFPLTALSTLILTAGQSIALHRDRVNSRAFR